MITKVLKQPYVKQLLIVNAWLLSKQLYILANIGFPLSIHTNRRNRYPGISH
jgi:hypothetical protein